MNTPKKKGLDLEIILDALKYYKASTLDRAKRERIEASEKQIKAKMPEAPIVSKRHTALKPDATYHIMADDRNLDTP